MRPPVASLMMIALLAAAGVAGAAEAPERDAAALTALEKMGAYLRTLTVFQIEAKTTDEDVLDDGQKIMYSGVTTVLAKKPAQFRASIDSDRKDRVLLYDGKTFTLYAKRANMYATVAAPPTILQLADKISADYGIEVPMLDLFLWGSEGKVTEGIKGASVVGPSDVDGTTCMQYAFRQDDIDWQIWIQRGDHPLPRRLVITTRTDEARPQHTVTYSWNLAPSFNDAAFTFDPPPSAQRIVFEGQKPAVAKAAK
jgi:hypothetical protein